MARATWRRILRKRATAFRRRAKLHDGGGTALYDAVYRACKEKFLKDRPDHPVRKAIVVVSDGEDNQSEIRPRTSHRNGAARGSDYLRDLNR